MCWSLWLCPAALEGSVVLCLNFVLLDMLGSALSSIYIFAASGEAPSFLLRK